MRSAITDVLPAPAPAIRKSDVNGWVMASSCSGVGVNGRSDIGGRLSARGLDGSQSVEGAYPAVGMHRGLELLGQDAVGDGEHAGLGGGFVISRDRLAAHLHASDAHEVELVRRAARGQLGVP